nr:family 78 glycoside hydrolase catalytic domain [uncultured Cohaesibacter sp.]
MTLSIIGQGGSVLATNLRCQHLACVSGLNSRPPFFGWALDNAKAAQDSLRQTAWRLVIGANENAVRQGRDLIWDSGKCIGESNFAYPDETLIFPPDSHLWWSVQVWDQDDEPSAWAEPAELSTGLAANQWQAHWIGRYFVLPAGRDVPQDNLYDNRFQARPADYLRREIALSERPVRATAYLSALGLYEFYINGERIGKDVMAPGWTDYHIRVEYQTHDVTNQLTAGDNCLGAIIGEGWYSGRIGHNQRRAGNHYGGRPAFLCQLQLEYADGHVETIISDESWMTRQGPICYSDFLAGEMVDARLSLDNWCACGIDTTYWQPVEEIIPEPDLPQIDAARSQPAREVARLEPKSRFVQGANKTIFDFGQNLSGYVEMTVRAREGTRFLLRHGEMLDADGRLYTENLRYAVSEDIYIASGKGNEIFHPKFTFHGFQYVELTVEGEPYAQPELTAIAIQTDTPVVGHMKTGHPMVNQLLSNIVWSQRDNFLSVPTDCPQRDERYGWAADAQVFWRTAGYFMDISAFLTKWMEDLIDGQSDDGVFPDVAPTKPLNPYRLTPQPGAPAWGDAPIIMGWMHYQRYGDKDLLDRCWTPFVSWMEYIERCNPDGIRRNQVHNNYGDWLSVGPSTDRELINTAYWIYIADLMAGIAAALEREADPWITLGKRLRTAFTEAFWAEDGRLKGDTQTAYLLALDFDILPEGAKELAAQRLLELIEQADGHLQTGFLGVRHLCPVLSDNGAEELAVSLLLKDTYPSWGFSIKHGATTIWERWDGWTEEKGFQSKAMNSFNHYAYGSVGEWIWSRLAGIDWDEEAPGFRSVIMRPIFDKRIGFVEATHDAHTGRITSNWHFEENEIHWEVSLPPSVHAKVTLPQNMTSDLGSYFALESGRHVIRAYPRSI